MDWLDEGTVLAARPHGESAAIVDLFTRQHGRHGGVVRGGAGRRMAAALQPGTRLAVAWRARLADQLGAFTVEPVRLRAGILAGAGPLAALNAACALLRAALPERAAHPALWARTEALFDALEAGEATAWSLGYLRWELALLEDIGFGLDLSACAVTGAAQGLAFVSPKSGRAVSRYGAGIWADRLLPLPACLIADVPPGPGEVAAGLRLTGFFLHRGLAPVLQGRPLPEARARLVARVG